MRKILNIFLLSAFHTVAVYSQQPLKPSASEIYNQLEKLNFLGTALYIAAHPDDENTRLISYLANDVKATTAYLSVTRGDGGQNLVGPEISELLGVIRTQELLAARKKDGGQQLFTRANDFGYSKHPDETLAIWNEKEVLGDIVRAIRKFRPDVIINRFDHRSPGSTHGHHTSSAMLSVDAFDLVGDATKYPETAETFGTWQPKRLFFNTSWWFYGSKEKFDAADKSKLIEVETGNYYPSLGLSNGEIASLSRSMHKSQGFGSTGSRGNETEYLEFLKGDFPTSNDLFDGIDTSWGRVENGTPIGNILNQVEKDFDFKNPSASIPALMKAYTLIDNLKDSYWKERKRKEISKLISDCAGLFIEAISSEQSTTPKGDIMVEVEIINRSNVSIKLNSISSPIISFPAQFAPTPLLVNQKLTIGSVENTFSGAHYTAPYWLIEKGTLGMYKVSNSDLIGLPEEENQFPIEFNLTIEGTSITIVKNIVYKFNDPVKGEVYRPFQVLPEATSSIPEKVLIFSSNASKEVSVKVRAGRDSISGTITLQHPEGWIVSPEQETFNLGRLGEEKTLIFTVKPPTEQNEGLLEPLLQIGNNYYKDELIIIDYDHIPYQSVLFPSEAKIVRIDISKKGQNIGYINGAGDAIPESLKQIGYTVTTLTPGEISEESLKPFDAIVVGIRAYNTVPDLAFTQALLNNYVFNGGTLVLQYNTNHAMVTEDIAPYSLKLSRDRVTDEDSEVNILEPKHEILNSPNKISQSDFEGWVQERGLYFPNEWSKEFTPILGMHDKDYPETKGSLLVANFGKGHYIYTGLSFFRELPAGVPGAYRLFANILSIGK